MKKWLFAALTVAVLVVSACAKAPYTGRNQFIMMDSQQEMALGASEAQKVVKSEQIDTTSDYARAVTRVGRRIAAVAGHPEYKWEFHTVKKDVPNAFCLPGGKIFVYTGLFEATPSRGTGPSGIPHRLWRSWGSWGRPSPWAPRHRLRWRRPRWRRMV
jgi:predicted Zn-dependent protease